MGRSIALVGLALAASLHGSGSQPPLAGRASPPFRTLNDWVLQVVASNPQLRKEAAPPAVAAMVAIADLFKPA